jgi:hypothetical protein
VNKIQIMNYCAQQWSKGTEFVPDLPATFLQHHADLPAGEWEHVPRDIVALPIPDTMYDATDFTILGDWNIPGTGIYFHQEDKLMIVVCDGGEFMSYFAFVYA